jgi:hypothetical protein
VCALIFDVFFPALFARQGIDDISRRNEFNRSTQQGGGAGLGHIALYSGRIASTMSSGFLFGLQKNQRKLFC